MPRDLPIGNGSLLVNFDSRYNLRDVYYPHVGQENQTGGHPSHFGVWADGQFAWLDSDDWQRDLTYEEETLVTQVRCVNARLGLDLRIADCVDFHRPLYVKRVEVKDLTGRERQVRLLQHLDPHLWGNAVGDTVLYEPDRRALVAYKARRYLWLGAQVGEGEDATVGLTRFACGNKELGSLEGTWRDAEDGELGGNPIAQGSVDGVGGVDVAVPAADSALAYFWLGAGQTFEEVSALHELVVARGPESFVERTRRYWHLWVNKEEPTFADLPEAVVRLYKRSLLILRTQIDEGGAITAANDADILQFGRDSYAYMWPRDGALVAHALVLSGYGQPSRRFFDFCADAIREEGYLLHKYNPDGSPGSSWHPWVGPDGQKVLPIQEDETALVLWALWAHFERFRDVEFVSPLYRRLIVRAADFLCRYREPHTGLPAPSWDLWEERRGILAYTTAAVFAGLEAAAHFADAFGETERAARYRAEAAAIREAARRYLYDPEMLCFSRMIRVLLDGAIERDRTIDASIAGVVQFGLLPPDDPLVEKTLEAIERRLWCETAVGGVARYEDDRYQQVSRDLERVPGNPWFICTLWLADWHAARAKAPEDLARTRELLTWAAERALPSGVLAEQVHPFTGEPLSVSPLTWSHATFVEAVQGYLARRAALTSESEARPSPPYGQNGSRAHAKWPRPR